MIKIFTSTCNRSELIELQLCSFKKHLQDDFELVVFNNSLLDRRKDAEYDKINAECHRLGLQVIDVERDQELANQSLETYPIFRGEGGVYWGPNSAAQYADNWIWKHIISKETGTICLIHPDVFLIRNIKLSDYSEKYHLSFISQSRPGAGEYMHDAVVLANISKLPYSETINWCAGTINGVAVDGGGQTHYYLKAYPNLSLFRIGISYEPYPGREAYPPPDYETFGFGDNHAMFHYRSVSNWNNQSEGYHEEKISWLKRMLEQS